MWCRFTPLPIRLMVGHIPLEDVIGVRVPDRQHGMKRSEWSANESKRV